MSLVSTKRGTGHCRKIPSCELSGRELLPFASVVRTPLEPGGPDTGIELLANIMEWNAIVVDCDTNLRPRAN